jgi:hypothetical protein
MKTKDFIEMLQKVDPSGEAYIRLPDGQAPYSAELKPGYWDGNYTFLEKINPDKGLYLDNVRIVSSIKGSKVDIYTIGADDIVWELNGDMDKIKDRFRFEFDGYVGKSKSEKEERYWKYVKESADYAKNYDDSFLSDWYTRVLDNYYYDEFCEVKQPLDKKIGIYNSMKFYHPVERPQQLNQGECEILIRSGKFYPEKKDDHYLWIHDPEKGKDWSIK